jgi:hypothetical protein
MNCLRLQDIHTKLHEYWFTHSSNIMAINATIFTACSVGVTERRDLWSLSLSWPLMA